MPHATPVPETSFLGAYAQRGAYTDCYALDVPGRVSVAELIEAVYTTPLFKIERWLLAVLLQLPSTDLQARQLALAQSDQFAAWKVEQRSEQELLLDAGQTRLWVSVLAADASSPASTLMLGSAVLPRRSNGRFGFAFHALLGFHRLYSKLLLAAAARRIAAAAAAVARAGSAA